MYTATSESEAVEAEVVVVDVVEVVDVEVVDVEVVEPSDVPVADVVVVDREVASSSGAKTMKLAISCGVKVQLLSPHVNVSGALTMILACAMAASLSSATTSGLS